MGQRGLERDQQQWGEPEKEGAGAQAGKGKLVVVSVNCILLCFLGEQLYGHGLGQPRGGRAAPRRWLLASCLRLEELAMDATTSSMEAAGRPAFLHLMVGSSFVGSFSSELL